ALPILLMTVVAAPMRADSDNSLTQEERRQIQIGLKIAPVPLKTAGKDVASISIGSFLVNVLADCNGCHTSNPSAEYTSMGNPYLLSPPFSGTKQVNPDTYLGGGSDFGVFPSPGDSVHITSRNLTPDKNGLPAGMTLAQFTQILRTGVDLDSAHPSCDANHTTNCLLPPFNGSLLQVMPWPAFQNLTDKQIHAIYNYLSAIPCLEGGPGEPPIRCQ
ncbi:MAG: hypothetical protein ABI693_16430, partial [Bryobacteraceae bacterium]